MTEVASPAPADGLSRADEADIERFETELEFVQALANPFYLGFLASSPVLFSSASFIAYLKYLRYWREPSYARFVHYPHALHHLDLLQNAAFRDALRSEVFVQELAHEQMSHWATWREPPTEKQQHEDVKDKDDRKPTTTSADAMDEDT